MRVLAYHAIFSAYGFWLPNDPRGSWSDFIRHWELLRFGRATKVETTRSVAGRAHDRDLRLAAKEDLVYPAVAFTGAQARAVGEGFKRAIGESGYTAHACAILPEHVHMVLLRHDHPAERMMAHLKGRATQRLTAEHLHPLAACRQADGKLPSPWARNGWAVFLWTEEQILRAIRYVEENPVREGKPRQRWSFVVPFQPSP